MYCNTLVCIAEERAETVSQYSQVYCGRKAGLGKNCIVIQKLYFDSRNSELLDCVVTHDRDTASQATTRQGRAAGGVGRAIGRAGGAGRRSRRAAAGRADSTNAGARRRAHGALELAGRAGGRRTGRQGTGRTRGVAQYDAGRAACARRVG